MVEISIGIRYNEINKIIRTGINRKRAGKKGMTKKSMVSGNHMVTNNINRYI
jgi:hypothetical protein